MALNTEQKQLLYETFWQSLTDAEKFEWALKAPGLQKNQYKDWKDAQITVLDDSIASLDQTFLNNEIAKHNAKKTALEAVELDM